MEMCGTVRKYGSNSSRELHRKDFRRVLRNYTEISWPGKVNVSNEV